MVTSMPNHFFKFKQFTVKQDRCAMKVTTDGCLFGAWVSEEVRLKDEANETSDRRILRALDIGGGTGLLSLMLAQKNDNVIIDMIEVDKDAASQASENINATLWEKRINVINADARDFTSTHKYDIIICNPPFYENELKAADQQKNIAHHGDMLSYKDILLIVERNLTAGGMFYFLFPYKRHVEIRKIFKEEFLISDLVFVRQTSHHEYFRLMLSGQYSQSQISKTTIDELAIKDEDGHYTALFKALLEAYYLQV
jgi:tRNA1Val (adenine37-N6)-methyltransferase